MRPLKSFQKLLLIAVAGIFFSAVFPPTLFADATPAAAHQPLSPQLWVGKFSQCSYNAVSSMLTYYYGPNTSKLDRQTFENTVFHQPLAAAGYEPYYGWGPWTSYMVESGKMVWNNTPVTDLRAERFSLRTADLPTLQAQSFIVHYQPNERDTLRDRLLKELARGPVVMWTCYAGAQEHPPAQPWHHVSRLDDQTDAVPFGPFTHSVTLYLLPRNPLEQGLSGDVDRILVTDCSVRAGVYDTDPDTIVSTASAMAAFVRLHGPGEKSMLQRGLNGIKDDQYNVVFFPSAATTQPATQPAADAAPISDDQSTLLSVVPEPERPGVAAAIARAGDRKTEWLIALSKVPSDQIDGFAFLLAGMPQRDLLSLDPEFVLENVSLAYQARAAAPWGNQVPEEVFLNAVLPYANLNEARDHWRPDFANRFSSLVRDCKTASDAALLLNATLFKEVGVKYHPTKRPKPDQSPYESMAASYASCTGLSILLVDACRAVGVPARVVGIPYWVKPKGDPAPEEAGNHTWVEIWDGQWHIIGASEVSKLDSTWFLKSASAALEGVSRRDGLDHHIYAACWRDTGTPFHMIWNESISYVPAEDVTASYAGRSPVSVQVGTPVHLTIRQNNRLIADLFVHDQTAINLSIGQRYDVYLNGGDQIAMSFVVPQSAAPVININPSTLPVPPTN